MPDEPPKIAVVAPNMVVSTPTFTLSGIITDDEAVTSAEWQIGSAAAVPLTLDAEGAFTITVEAPALDSQGFVITLRARDARTQTTKDVTVQVDRVAPALRLVRPDAGTLVGEPTVEVAVEAIDGSGTLADLSIDGQPVSMPRSGVEAVQMIQVPATHNGDPVDFVVTSADPSGNRATQTFSFVGDRVAPRVSIMEPTSGQVISTAQLTVAITVDDPSPIAAVAVHLGNTTIAATETSPGHWTANVPTTIEEAYESITIDATDAAGNHGMATQMIRVDRIAPTVSVVSPAAGSLHSVDFTATVTTSADTASVSATLEGQTVMLTGGPTLWTGLVPVPQQRDYSNVTLTVNATDGAGNSSSTDVMVAIDNESPEVQFPSPSQDQRFNASSFTTGTDVVVRWTVTDADPQAPTMTVNGSPTTSFTLSVPTNPTDNPATYSTTVTATDRAGNVTTFAVHWSVDRVVPTVVSWTPANNTRNVEPWQSVITFSEPVSGALSTSPALTITGQTAPTNDSWNTAHTTYTLPLDTFKNQVLDVGIAANVADDYGNPVAAATRRFHLATGFPSGTNIAITTAIVAFDASSDSDGVISIAAIAPGVRLIQDFGGYFAEIPNPSPPASPSVIAVNSATVINASTLRSSPRVGIVSNDSGQSWRGTSIDRASVTSALDSNGAVALISRPPLANEPSGANVPFGTIIGNTYTRGTVTRTLSNLGRAIVAQSNDSWATFNSNPTQVLWSHYRCRALITGGYNCGSIGYGSSTTAPTALQTAMTPAGNCLATSWTSGGTRQAVFQALTSCDLTTCFDDLNLAPVSSALVPQDLRVAPYGANGENTLLFSYRSGVEFVLAKMTQACGPGGATELGRVPAGTFHQPVRVGNRPGLLYVAPGNILRLYVP